MKCNICGHPGIVKHTFINPETNKMVTEERSIGCLGHPYIHPSRWNFHPEYAKYAQMRNQQRAKNYS